MKIITIPAASFCFILLILSGCTKATEQSRQYLYTGPEFLTGNEDQPTAKAILVDQNGIIISVFSKVPSSIEKKAEKIVLPGTLAMPGIHDAHLHLNFMRDRMEGIDLRNVKSGKEIRGKIEKYIKKNPQKKVIYGWDWDDDNFAQKGYPTKSILKGFSSKLIFLRRVDGHTVLVNDSLLAKAGITAGSKETDTGITFRSKDGIPTGILQDNAILLVEKYLPEISKEERLSRLRKVVNLVSKNGITTVHDMLMDAEMKSDLKQLHEKGELPFRVFAYYRGDEFYHLIFTSRIISENNFEILGIKLFMDGSLGGRGALLHEPYSDDTTKSGHVAFDPDLQRWVFRFAEFAGYKIAIHAIGDKANTMALSFVEDHHDYSNHPVRIEHAQVLRPHDFNKFHDLKVIASMQPPCLIADMSFSEKRVGKERAKGVYAFNSMIKNKAALAFGSDSPFSYINPFIGFYGALTRKHHKTKKPKEGWYPQERVSFKDVLKGYTSGAACAVGKDSIIGTLEKGKFFDCTVVDKDCRKNPEGWLKARVTATIVGGKRVK
ncbi:MAG: amidohydrolase [bacterium]|nr:amidohydrolase [bacterium]